MAITKPKSHKETFEAKATKKIPLEIKILLPRSGCFKTSPSIRIEMPSAGKILLLSMKHLVSKSTMAIFANSETCKFIKPKFNQRLAPPILLHILR